MCGYPLPCAIIWPIASAINRTGKGERAAPTNKVPCRGLLVDVALLLGIVESLNERLDLRGVFAGSGIVGEVAQLTGGVDQGVAGANLATAGGQGLHQGEAQIGAAHELAADDLR